MLERNNQPNARRADGDPFRRMIFGGNGSRRSAFDQQARPVMERVSPQALGENMTANGENGQMPLFSSCLNACSLAMVYAPEQAWKDLFPVGKALGKGTLFGELDKPFLGKTLLGR